MAPSRPVDYEKYLRSAKWRNISAAMKKYVNFTCQSCKVKFHPGELDVHHRTYDRLGNERPSDLQVLCRSNCHPIADARRVEKVAVRREQRQYDAASHTFLSKKYGDNYASFADEGMYEEFERWRAKKHYAETGEDW
jgi:5-methylcytosine-specific restriction endonuclease McrA